MTSSTLPHVYRAVHPLMYWGGPVCEVPLGGTGRDMQKCVALKAKPVSSYIFN